LDLNGLYSTSTCSYGKSLVFGLHLHCLQKSAIMYHLTVWIIYPKPLASKPVRFFSCAHGFSSKIQSWPCFFVPPEVRSFWPVLSHGSFRLVPVSICPILSLGVIRWDRMYRSLREVLPPGPFFPLNGVENGETVLSPHFPPIQDLFMLLLPPLSRRPIQPENIVHGPPIDVEWQIVG
jgi:hypothetical protein